MNYNNHTQKQTYKKRVRVRATQKQCMSTEKRVRAAQDIA